MTIQSQITDLREKMKAEQMEVLRVADNRRRNSRPGEVQKILLWENSQLKKTEAKYAAAIDRLMREALGELKPKRSVSLKKLKKTV